MSANNGNYPATPTPDGRTGLTKHESASLQILCSLLKVRGHASDNDLTTHACQIADLWFDKLEVWDEEQATAPSGATQEQRERENVIDAALRILVHKDAITVPTAWAVKLYDAGMLRKKGD